MMLKFSVSLIKKSTYNKRLLCDFMHLIKYVNSFYYKLESLSALRAENTFKYVNFKILRWKSLKIMEI